MGDPSRPLDLLAVLSRRRGIVVGSFVVVVAAVALGTWLQTPLYEAKAWLLVESMTPTYRGYEEMPVLAAPLDVGRSRSTETHKRLITSLPILEEATIGLGLDASGPELADRVRAETFRDTDVLELYAQDEDPQAAADIANALASFYVEQSQSYNRQAVRSARDFLEEQVQQAREKLKMAEDELHSFKRKSGIADLSAETQATIDHLARLRALQAEADADARASEERGAQTRRELAQQPVTQDYSRVVRRNPVVVSLQEQLANLEIQRGGLLETYVEQAPEVRAVDAEIRQARTEVARQVENILGDVEERINPVHEALLISSVQQEAEASAMRKRDIALGRSVASVTARLNNVPAKEAELARLTRAQRVAESVFTLLLGKQHEVRLAESMQLSNVRLWKSARPPTSPILPRKMLNMALAVIFGALLGLLLARLAEYVDDSIKDPDEARAVLGLPVMGVVPFIRRDGERLLTRASGRSVAAEAHRLALSSIRSTAADRPIKTLLVTSPGSQAGKTTTALNLAVVMAEQGTRVILVDANLRRPALHRYMGMQNDRGLADLLAGETSRYVLIETLPTHEVRPTTVRGLNPTAAGLTLAQTDELLASVRAGEALKAVAHVQQETHLDNLMFVAAGPAPPSPAELLASPRAGEVLRALAEVADVVIVDSPPADMVADAAILAEHVDAALVVIEENATPRRAALSVKERLEAARVNLVGSIVSKSITCRRQYEYGADHDGYRPLGEPTGRVLDRPAPLAIAPPPKQVSADAAPHGRRRTA